MKQNDILYSSWGYDQTNIDWYQVIERRGEWVTLQEIGGSAEYDQATMTGMTLPNSDEKVGDPFRRKVQAFHDGQLELVKVDNGRARLWDGTPQRYSSYA